MQRDDGIARQRARSYDPAREPEDSLLRIPLLRQALSDRQIRWAPRAVDRAWSYEGIVPVSVVGFNPFSRRVFYGASSRLATWLERPGQPARGLNAGDFLIHEVLFAVHDYLHAWAYLAINHLAPAVGLGTARLTAGRLEDLAFCHILTEAVATVGLDYWYLSTVHLNDVTDLGTRLRGPLTVPYHEDDAHEFRRFDPTLAVQDPRFFERLVHLYCEGTFEGFEAEHVEQSALLLRWMRHEITYARTQREGIRLWLAHLAGLDVATSARRAPPASGGASTSAIRLRRAPPASGGASTSAIRLRRAPPASGGASTSAIRLGRAPPASGGASTSAIRLGRAPPASGGASTSAIRLGRAPPASGGASTSDPLSGPLDSKASWKRRLVRRLGALLWEKVKEDVVHRFRPSLADGEVWRAPADAPLDYRFLNAQKTTFDPARLVPESFPWLAWQTMSARRLATVDRKALRLLGAATDRCELDLVLWLLRGAEPVARRPLREVRELFLPN